MRVSAALARNLKNRRELANITQQELADKSGVSRQTIYNLENEKTGFDLSTIQSLAHVLKCEETDLVSDPSLMIISDQLKMLSKPQAPSEINDLWTKVTDSDRDAILNILRGRIKQVKAKKA